MIRKILACHRSGWKAPYVVLNKLKSLAYQLTCFSSKANASDVYYASRLFLGRPPTPDEWNVWLLRWGSVSLEEVSDCFYAKLGYPRRVPIITDSTVPEPTLAAPVSQLVTQKQVESEEFKHWCAETKEMPGYHRKLWEFAYILQVLHQHDLLRAGATGLGFGVGKEPLAAVMAKYGCRIMATDQDADSAQREGWRVSNQHSNSFEDLNERSICEPERFRQLVSFRTQDMNHISADLMTAAFDFIWSACALEHVGSIALAKRFILESLYCLKPGGVAIHTTEYNLSSNSDTLMDGPNVIFRRRDIEELRAELEKAGYRMVLNLNAGKGPLDRHYDVPPYKGIYHLRFMLDNFISTSIGLIIHKPEILST
jgi:2-polyprenyl-3-methyl-5-hydroxy-6-metoxy-1,4-benzoquinol methylase